MIACFVCNNLKGDFVPEEATHEDRVWSARNHIMERRSERMKDFDSWCEEERQHGERQPEG